VWSELAIRQRVGGWVRVCVVGGWMKQARRYGQCDGSELCAGGWMGGCVRVCVQWVIGCVRVGDCGRGRACSVHGG
jgi:hypothetical protein